MCVCVCVCVGGWARAHLCNGVRRWAKVIEHHFCSVPGVRAEKFGPECQEGKDARTRARALTSIEGIGICHCCQYAKCLDASVGALKIRCAFVLICDALWPRWTHATTFNRACGSSVISGHIYVYLCGAVTYRNRLTMLGIITTCAAIEKFCPSVILPDSHCWQVQRVDICCFQNLLSGSTSFLPSFLFSIRSTQNGTII